jgi:hypothetical protein
LPLFIIEGIWSKQTTYINNHIGGVMVSVLVSSTGDREFEPRSDQIKDYKIGICCFSTNHAALRRESKDWLAQNQNNVSEWSDMSTRRLLFQWASTIKSTFCNSACWSSTKRTSSSSHWKLICSLISGIWSIPTTDINSYCSWF